MIFVAGDNIAGKSVAGNNNIRLNIKTNSVDANYKTNILLNIKHNSVNANYKQTSKIQLNIKSHNIRVAKQQNFYNLPSSKTRQHMQIKPILTYPHRRSHRSLDYFGIEKTNKAHPYMPGRRALHEDFPTT